MDGRDYSVLIQRLALSFGLFFITRILFAVFNWDYFSATTLLEMGHAVTHGLRFDLATVLAVNVFFILVSLIPITHHLYFYFKKIIFFIFNGVFLLANFVDMKFFPFLGRKLTADVFDMGTDISDQGLQLIFNYWYMAILYFGTLYILWRFYPVKKKTIMHIPSLSWWKVIIIGFCTVILTAIGIRGGVQMRSISVKQAFIFEKYELGNLAINAAYTFIRSFDKKSLEKKTFFSSDKEAVEYIKNSRSNKKADLSHRGQNIVFIIVESFSQEYVDQGYTPFFSELAKKGLYLSHNYANGRRSLEALPSILAGIPSLLSKPLYQTPYQANSYYALPQILEENGYKTSFFHGGKKGTMDFDAYCDSLGIDKYYSLSDYPNQDHYDGHWGIYDHQYLDFFASKLDKEKTPFFSTIFTLSSHQPYSVPKGLKMKFRKGTLEIHESIGYVDYSLEKFFTKNKDKDWFKNTLFVITADHTQKLETKKFNNLLGKYRVPLLFYHPQIELSELNHSRVTQHADILPSVLDFLGINNSSPLHFGSSVFAPNEGIMLNFLSNRFIYQRAGSLVTLNGDDVRVYSIDQMNNMSQDSNLDDVQKLKLIQELKAYIQYFYNGLKTNNLYKN